MKHICQARDFEVFEYMSHPVWVFDIDKEAMWWANGPAVRLWNAESRDALLARNFTDTSEATKERLATYLRKFEKGESFVEQWTFYPKGEPCVVICNCSGVRIDNGRMALLIEGRPISKTDIEPNVLRCVEALHHTSLMVTIFSLEGEVIYNNPSASRNFLTGADSFASRCHKPQTAAEIWGQVLAGKFVSVEAEFNTRSGVRWHGIDCKLTRDPVEGNQVVLCNQRDLHDLKKTELDLEKAIVRAEQMAHFKSRFLANMSHEIRTPLNGVIGMAELLAVSQLQEDQREYVTHMQDAAQILRTLIDDILDYSKLEAGRLVLMPTSFSLEKCFMTCVAMIEPLAKAKQLQFTATYELPADLSLRGDEVRISQILLNILGNAVKFTASGEVRFSVMQLASSGDRCSLRFKISDTGIGIAEQDQDKLFTRFTQLDNSPLRGQAGTGLGLAICRELIEMMDGRILLDSCVDSGSTFQIELDLPEVSPTPRADLAPVEDSASRLLILLVEDNKTNQLVAGRMLERLGHHSLIANTGAEALSLLEQHKPDLILMDVIMPVMDGISATRKIRERETGQHRTPIIALTANVLPEEQERCYAADMDDFLAKPLDFETLRRVLAKWSGHDN